MHMTILKVILLEILPVFYLYNDFPNLIVVR